MRDSGIKINSTVNGSGDKINSGQPIREKYILRGLNCPSCAAKIEETLNESQQVIAAELNYAAGTIAVTAEEITAGDMQKKVQEIAGGIEPGLEVVKPGNENVKKSVSSVNTEGFSGESNGNYDRRSKLKNSGSQENKAGGLSRISGDHLRLGSGIVLFVLALVVTYLSSANALLPFWVELTLYITSYLLIGGPVILAAVRNIKRGSLFDENFLMTVATIGAFGIREFPEAVAVMLFYEIGEMFQERAVDSSRRSIKDLMDLKPEFASKKMAESIKQVAPETLKPGDLIVVKPGEKVPVDGEVVAGTSMLDTSALTGESLPRSVEKGDEILSGVINRDQLLTVKVTREYERSTVAKILELVENAGARKAPTEKFITRFARYYTPVIVFTALALAVIPPLVLPGAVFTDWFYRALIFLVISCPCALVISIPLGFFAGIGRASRNGVLVKGGNYLEALQRVETAVFDKTGTLTEGNFMVAAINTRPGFSKTELLELAAAAETNSNHPLADAVLRTYEGNIDREKIESHREIAGQGVRVNYKGREIMAGNYRLMQNNNIILTEEQETAGRKRENTVIYIAVEGEIAGYLTAADNLKPGTGSLVKELKENGVNKVVMLTGDKEEVARQAADQMGLDSYYADLLPDEKVARVEELLAGVSGRDKLAYIGDGINDAPVLARADIGVAMGGLGSDAAIEAADVVLMTDEPGKLVTALKIAARTRAIVWQNIILALGVKGLVLVLGILGLATMWAAVFADVGVALLAVFNSLRLVIANSSDAGG